MDYNDFTNRLKRTLASLNARFDDEIAVEVTHKKRIVRNPDNTQTSTISFSYKFGNLNEEELINKIFIMLYNLASLKDHLKNNMQKNNFNPQIVEDEINNSLHLQVLIDIVNQEKHGYPLKKSNRSNKNPLVINIKQALQITTRSGANIFFTPTGLKTKGEAQQQMIINADIVDGEENLLFTLDDLLETCYSKFKKIGENHSCC